MTTENGNAEAETAEAVETAGVSMTVDQATAKLLGGQEGDAGAAEAGEETAAGDGADAGADAEDAEKKSDESVQFSPEQQAIFEREIGKKVAKFKATEDELRSKIEALEQRLESQPAQEQPAREGADLLGLTPEQLDEQERKAEELLDWCEEHLDGYEADPDKKGDVSMTAEQVLAARRKVRRVLRDIPRARNQQHILAEAEKHAVEIHPELRKGGKDRAIYEGFARIVPAIRVMPNGLTLTGDMILGERLRTGQLNAEDIARFMKKDKAAVKPKAPVAPVLPGAGGVKKPTVAAAGGKQPSYTLSQMVKDGGTVDAATRLMMARDAQG